jgi:hypothetical protein
MASRTASAPWPASAGPFFMRGALPDRSERRFRLFIATSFIQVLRQPFESAQYCSIDYQAELRKHGILISMSGKGNCYDNAMVETFFRTLKSELVWRTIFYTRQEADQAIGRYIDGFYNPVRRHSCPRLHKPDAVRKNGRQMTQCLSIKAGQVQLHFCRNGIARYSSSREGSVQYEVCFRSPHGA